MRTASDIMVKNIITCTDIETMFDGHKLMQEHQIRHIPIVSHEDGHYIGMVTHKEVLKEVIQITDAHGTNRMDRYETRVKLMDILAKDVDPIKPDSSIEDAGQYFLDNKHGCLPVCNGDQLLGVITSTDFVKLSLQLLKDA